MTAKSDKTTPLVLFPIEVIRRIPKRYLKGLIHYGNAQNVPEIAKPIANNWEDGVDDLGFIYERFNHMLLHGFEAVQALREGDKEKTLDELDGACANSMMLLALVERSKI